MDDLVRLDALENNDAGCENVRKLIKLCGLARCSTSRHPKTHCSGGKLYIGPEADMPD